MRPFQRTPLGRFVGWAGSKDEDYWMMGVLHVIMGTLVLSLLGVIVAIPFGVLACSEQEASPPQHTVQCVDCNHAACEHGTCPSVCEACLPAKEETP